LLFLQMGKQYKPYWFSTATPTFLFELMKKKQYYLPRFENFTAGYRDFDVIELGKYELESLLFQTGYLTIKSMTSDVTGVTYQLGFPNTEVQSAFAELALSEYLLTDQPNTTGIKKALLAENIEGIRECVVSLFAGIAHDNYRNNPIANYEGFYASVLYAYLASLGFILIAEDTTSVGRIDLSVQMINRHGQRIVYIFELKTAHDKAEQSMMDDPALRQIKDRRYADKYRHDHATIYLISMIFSRTTKSLVAFNHEITH
jgi:hypothetical protein